MNKYQALYKFFNSFGIPFYLDTNVPNQKEISYPYGTYQSVNGMWTDIVSITVRLYYRTSSEVEINKMVESIAYKINGGHYVVCDEGAMFISAGTPFCQAVIDDTDTMIKSRYINMNIEYLTR